MTTKTDYSKLTNQELDKLAAEMVDLNIEYGYVWDGEIKVGLWNPTHPDSNQAFRYLWSKLKETTGVEFTVSDTKRRWSAEVWLFDELVCSIRCYDEKLINRVAVMLCLEAKEKLK